MSESPSAFIGSSDLQVFILQVQALYNLKSLKTGAECNVVISKLELHRIAQNKVSLEQP